MRTTWMAAVSCVVALVAGCRSPLEDQIQIRTEDVMGCDLWQQGFMGWSMDELLQGKHSNLFDGIATKFHGSSEVERTRLYLALSEGLPVITTRDRDSWRSYNRLMVTLMKEESMRVVMGLYLRLPFIQRAYLAWITVWRKERDWESETAMVRLVEWRRSHRFTESEVERYGISPDFLVDWGSDDPYGRYIDYVSTLDRPRRIYEYGRFLTGEEAWASKLREWLGEEKRELSCQEYYRGSLERFYDELLEKEPMDFVADLVDYKFRPHGGGTGLVFECAYRYGPALVGKVDVVKWSRVLAVDTPEATERVNAAMTKKLVRMRTMGDGRRHVFGLFLLQDLQKAAWIGDEQSLKILEEIEALVDSPDFTACLHGQTVRQVDFVREIEEKIRHRLTNRAAVPAGP